MTPGAAAAVSPKHSQQAPGLDDLLEFIRIPSVSADPEHTDDVERAARWVADYVDGIGGETELLGPTTHPLVVGEIPASDGAGSSEIPTVILYGHYDVQPADDLDDWKSPPFEPTIDGEWLYGRGSADDKGNLFVLLKAVKDLSAAGQLPVNVRVLSDGEEEIIGHSVAEFVLSDPRPADACVIFDGPMLQLDQPLFVVGTRGLLYFHVVLRTGRGDMHSGFVGGAALNAAHAVAETVVRVRRTLRELEQQGVQATAAERSAWSQLPDAEALLTGLGGRPADSGAIPEFYERTMATAAVEVHGIRCGEADLQKTVVPAEATFNLSVRLVPGQDPERVSARVEEVLRESAPEGADVVVEQWACTPASLMRGDSEVIQRGREAFEEVFGNSPPVARTGGTVPLMSALAESGIPTIMTGLDTLEGNAHAPNERFRLEYLSKGVDVAKAILTKLGRLEAIEH